MYELPILYLLRLIYPFALFFSNTFKRKGIMKNMLTNNVYISNFSFYDFMSKF